MDTQNNRKNLAALSLGALGVVMERSQLKWLYGLDPL